MRIKPTADNPAITFNACTTRGKDTFVWNSYRYYRAARRLACEKRGYYGSPYDGWYVERQKVWYDNDDKIHVSGVIIAQGKDTIAKNRFRVIA